MAFLTTNQIKFCVWENMKKVDEEKNLEKAASVLFPV